MLKPAVVRRILIMPYQSKDAQIWNGSRHVYYIEQKPRVMMTDIFLAAPISTTGEDCLASCKNKLRTSFAPADIPPLSMRLIKKQ
jgi:hypothetical protein